VTELAERDDALENAILAARVTFRGEELPLRSAQARLALLTGYADRDSLGELHADASATFNEARLELLRAAEELEAELSGEPDPVARSEEEKAISLRELEAALVGAAEQTQTSFAALRERWFDRLLGPDRAEHPTSHHSSFLRRLTPLDSTYTKDRSVEICLDTLERLGFRMADDPNIRLDLDDRPQKSPRACVIASDPPQVVHLITRAQGGLHDYQAFLHEAGHALHYAGCNPALAYTFRRLARDHALTEIYSYILEAITREPAWHAEYFGLSDEQAAENAEGTVFLEALLYHRYVAKLRFELGFWSRFAEDGGTPDGYAELLSAATGMRYRADGFRHGRRLLLGRLPARLDPLDAAPLAPRARDRRGLVAEPRDRRAPARPLLRGHAALERGGGGSARLHAARHRAARPRAERRLVTPGQSSPRELSSCVAASTRSTAVRPASHSASSRIPVSRSTCGS